jgi:WD40 repeat protein
LLYIYGKGAYIALGGYWNGNIIVKSLDYKIKQKDSNKTTYIYSTNETSPITKITIDESETFAICGNKLGNVFIFVINPEKKYNWSLSKILSYHKSEITSLAISENLNMFISCSKDGNCMLYSLPKIKLFNSFNIEFQNENEKNEINNVYCSKIIIFHTPLPCFIFYIKNLNYLYVYSINGKFLKKHKLEYEIVNNGIVRYIDYQLKDYLMIYNSKDKTIDVYRGIDFEFITKSPVIDYTFIDFALSKNLDQLLILVENNENDGKKLNQKYKVLVLKDKENQLNWK